MMRASCQQPNIDDGDAPAHAGACEEKSGAIPALSRNCDSARSHGAVAADKPGPLPLSHAVSLRGKGRAGAVEADHTPGHFAWAGVFVYPARSQGMDFHLPLYLLLPPGGRRGRAC